MLDPQFLAQIRSYLNENGNRALDSGIGSLLGSGTAPTNATTASKSDALTSGIQSGISSVVGHAMTRANDKEETKKKQEWMPIPVQMNMPPPGYRPGYDPEWNYGIGNPQTATDIRAYNATLPQNAVAASSAQPQHTDPIKSMWNYALKKFQHMPSQHTVSHMGTGGTISTGNQVADRAIANGDERVIRNQEAAATYAAMDNARDGTPIPEHLQQRLDARGSSGSSAMDRNDYSPSSGFSNTSRGGGLGSILSGHIAGYNGWGDMVNGGGRYGSYANPGSHVGGLQAMGQDISRGGLGALLRDSFDGGGYGASGKNFVGGPRSWALNLFGVNPVASNHRFLGTDANDYGTNGTEGKRPHPRPRGMAEGGMTGDPVVDSGNEKDLISQAVSAIKGEVQDPRPVLAAFVQKYGEDALRNLVDKVESGDMQATAQKSQGHLRGPGDGMSDMIPASVDGSNDVLLSDGEYVVPADVVSGLGNGSSDAGSKHLDEMMARVRQRRTGSKEQAKQINPKQAMPA